MGKKSKTVKRMFGPWNLEMLIVGGIMAAGAIAAVSLDSGPKRELGKVLPENAAVHMKPLKSPYCPCSVSLEGEVSFDGIENADLCYNLGTNKLNNKQVKVEYQWAYDVYYDKECMKKKPEEDCVIKREKVGYEAISVNGIVL